MSDFFFLSDVHNKPEEDPGILENIEQAVGKFGRDFSLWHHVNIIIITIIIIIYHHISSSSSSSSVEIVIHHPYSFCFIYFFIEYHTCVLYLFADSKAWLKKRSFFLCFSTLQAFSNAVDLRVGSNSNTILHLTCQFLMGMYSAIWAKKITWKALHNGLARAILDLTHKVLHPRLWLQSSL